MSKPILPELFIQKGNRKNNYLNIQNLRYRLAKELIETTALSVKEIAGAIGYEDQNYFSRIFKKIEGVSPLVYKQNCSKQP
ncbi:MAG: hypothetical protein A2Y21_03080 [Clostridiales bacterium GWC2_40_7]|nr:MAG: hypothetical protein A2Y21_03080 [Clostridiales bacterium GWC2_40_7]